MDATSFDDLVSALPTARAALESLATAADVPYHTLLKIARGETRNPRIRTVEAIRKALATPPSSTQEAA